MEDLIIDLANGIIPSDKDLSRTLYEICDSVHSSCNNACPVYMLNGGCVPDTAYDFNVNRGCDTFKDGNAMLEFIRNASK